MCGHILQPHCNWNLLVHLDLRTFFFCSNHTLFHPYCFLFLFQPYYEHLRNWQIIQDFKINVYNYTPVYHTLLIGNLHSGQVFLVNTKQKLQLGYRKPVYFLLKLLYISWYVHWYVKHSQIHNGLSFRLTNHVRVFAIGND